MNNIPLCVYTTFLVSIIYWKMLGLLPSLDYCKQCCITICLSSCVYWELLGNMIIVCLTYWGVHNCFLEKLYPFTFPPAIEEDSNFSTSLPTLIFAFLIKPVGKSGILFFGFHFPSDTGYWACFHGLFWHFYVIFEEIYIQVLWPCLAACRILVFQSGMEPASPALGGRFFLFLSPVPPLGRQILNQ